MFIQLCQILNDITRGARVFILQQRIRTCPIVVLHLLHHGARDKVEVSVIGTQLMETFVAMKIV